MIAKFFCPPPEFCAFLVPPLRAAGQASLTKPELAFREWRGAGTGETAPDSFRSGVLKRPWSRVQAGLGKGTKPWEPRSGGEGRRGALGARGWRYSRARTLRVDRRAGRSRGARTLAEKSGAGAAGRAGWRVSRPRSLQRCRGGTPVTTVTQLLEAGERWKTQVALSLICLD